MDSKFPFKKDFEVEIATRHAYYDEKSFDSAALMYSISFDIFPTSAVILFIVL